MLQQVPDGELEEYTVPVLYRPFDTRWIFYHDSIVWRTVKRIMCHMFRENVGIIVPRRVEVAGGWQHALVTNLCADHVSISLKTIDYLFPIYRYPDPQERPKLSHFKRPEEKTPNLSASLLKALKDTYGRKPTSEQIFQYVYAVLYSPAYRTKYAEFLKTDFPRVPFARDQELFLKVAALGKRVAELHLLKSSELDQPIARFQGQGNNKVEKPRYDEKAKRVYINNAQHFEGVEPEVWEYQIGGYQVLDKWLKDRKGRPLNLEDIRHYCRVVTALAKTIEIQAEIDVLYPHVEKHTLMFNLEGPLGGS